MMVNTVLRGRSTSHAGSEPVAIVCPPAWLVNTLRKIDSVPSVTMIDGTLANATSTPLTSPRPAPIADRERRPRRATEGPGCSASISAVRYAATPTVEPTDRSMLRVMITSDSPAASNAVMETAMRRRLTNRALR